MSAGSVPLTMNVTTPSSCTADVPFIVKSDLKVLYIATEFIIAILAVTGNFLVCLAVTLNKKLRTVTNYFLVNHWLISYNIDKR